MDPLTHTLVGAGLAATELGRKSRGATAALILGANLPDVDVLSYFRDSDFALGFRRGWTHGIPALLILPAVLVGALLLWHRWRRSDDESPALSPRWLLITSYLACATHPCLDWLNTYGMRWWMPFRDTWTYGDAVFIVDPWLWLILGLGWLIGRHPTPAGTAAGSVIAALVVWLVAVRAARFLPIVVGVLAVLVVAYLRSSWPGWLTRQRIAAIGLSLGGLYILAMLSLHALTVARVEEALASRAFGEYQELMTGPVPADPLVWDIVVGTPSAYRWGRWDWRQRSLWLSDTRLPVVRDSELWPQLTASSQSPGFLAWTRFPWFDSEETAGGRRIYLMDARYARDRRSGFGATVIELAQDPPRHTSP